MKILWNTTMFQQILQASVVLFVLQKFCPSGFLKQMGMKGVEHQKRRMKEGRKECEHMPHPNAFRNFPLTSTGCSIRPVGDIMYRYSHGKISTQSPRCQWLPQQHSKSGHLPQCALDSFPPESAWPGVLEFPLELLLFTFQSGQHVYIHNSTTQKSLLLDKCRDNLSFFTQRRPSEIQVVFKWSKDLSFTVHYLAVTSVLGSSR